MAVSATEIVTTEWNAAAFNGDVRITEWAALGVNLGLGGDLCTGILSPTAEAADVGGRFTSVRLRRPDGTLTPHLRATSSREDDQALGGVLLTSATQIDTTQRIVLGTFVAD